MPEDELLENLAKIEHEQWVEWSKELSKKILYSFNLPSEIPKEIREKLQNWSNLWIPYSELTEEMKEIDRKYARKVIKSLKEIGNFDLFLFSKDHKITFIEIGSETNV